MNTLNNIVELSKVEIDTVNGGVWLPSAVESFLDNGLILAWLATVGTSLKKYTSATPAVPNPKGDAIFALANFGAGLVAFWLIPTVSSLFSK